MADIDGLDDFLNHMQRVESSIDNIIKESLDETATMVIADTKLKTPVKAGTLKRSWTHDNVEHEGNKFDNVTYKTIRNEDRRSSSESKRIIRKIDNMLENELNSEQ